MRRTGNEGNPKILVVDDEEEVLRSLADLLRKDFFVHTTSNVDEAMESLATQEFAIVISDQRMPTKTGVELLSRGAGISPDTVRILLTAYSDIEAVIRGVNSGRIYHYVAKPWEPESLLGMLKEAAKRQQLVAENKRLIREVAEVNNSIREAGSRISVLEGGHLSLQQDNETLKSTLDHLRNSFWHLKKDREFLSFCMECGKVKTGEAAWEDVAKFLHDHSDFLSHGYCPDCFEKIKERLETFVGKEVKT